MLFLIGAADSVILRVPEHPGAILNRTDSIQNETHGNLTVQRDLRLPCISGRRSAPGCATLRRKGGRAVSARGRWQAHPAARLNCRNYSSPRGARRRGQRHGRRSAAAARAGLISRRRGPKASFIEKDGQLAIAKAMCRNRRDYAV